ncbi:MAG: rhomboid family intramembrane serine protease [Planctomycetes bacterium]|nr:rhomboid family intramembrane serine protease [Planctomycetota bacterium]
MGFSDRPYSYDDQQPTLRGQLAGTSVTVWLIVINVLVYILTAIFTQSARASALSPLEWGGFNIDDGVYRMQLWRWFTYQFIHAGLFHILFNMMVLFYFGPWIERMLGPRKYLAFYLLCGCCGAVVYTLLSMVPGLLGEFEGGMLVGASGSIFGLIVACAVRMPHQEIMLWGAIRMTMRTLALILLGVAVLSVVVGSMNAGGDAAHLGGALLGFVLIRNDHWLNLFDRLSTRHISPAQLRDRYKRGRFQDKLKKQAASEQEIDRILAKVSQQGLQSLTRREQKFLRQTSEEKRGQD